MYRLANTTVNKVIFPFRVFPIFDIRTTEKKQKRSTRLPINSKTSDNPSASWKLGSFYKKA